MNLRDEIAGLKATVRIQATAIATLAAEIARINRLTPGLENRIEKLEAKART